MLDIKMRGSENPNEVIVSELRKNFLIHPLLKGKEKLSDPVYAEALLKLADSNFGSFYFNNAVALELLALSFRKHFLQEAKPLNIIKGDFYYARALNYTVSGGQYRAVEILARAVVRQAVFVGHELAAEPFISLLEAAAGLDLLNRTGKIFAADSPEVIENLKRLSVHFEKRNMIKINDILKKSQRLRRPKNPEI